MCSDFMFDPEEFRRVRAEWEELQRQVGQARGRFQDLVRSTFQLPAEDVVTRGFLERARAAVDAAHVSNGALRSYVDAYLANLERTAATYASGDADNARLLKGTTET